MLFEDVPLARETADDGGYATLSELLILSKRQLSLEDLRSAVFRFAAFAEGPQADVRNVRKAVHTLTQLVEPLRGFYGERPGMVRKRDFCGLRGAAAVSRLAGLHAQAGDLRFLVRMVGVWMTRHVGESCPRGEEGVSGGG